MANNDTFEQIQLGGNIRRVITSSNANFAKLLMPTGSTVKGDVGGLKSGTDVSNEMVTTVLSTIISGVSNSVEIAHATITGGGFTLSASNTYSIPFGDTVNTVTSINITSNIDLKNTKAVKSVVVTTYDEFEVEIAHEEITNAAKFVFPEAENYKSLEIVTGTTTIAGNQYQVAGKSVILEAVITLEDGTTLRCSFNVVTVAKAYYGVINKVDITKVNDAAVLAAIKAITPNTKTSVTSKIEDIVCTTDLDKTFFIASSTNLPIITTFDDINVIDKFYKVTTNDSIYKYIYLLKPVYNISNLQVFFNVPIDGSTGTDNVVTNSFIQFKNVWYTETAPLDAKVIAANADALDKLKAVAYQGMIVYNSDDGLRYVYNGIKFVALRPFPLKDDATIATADEISYNGTTVKKTLDDLGYTKIQILSFENDVKTAEKGQVITNVTFKWLLNNAEIKKIQLASDVLESTALTKSYTNLSIKDNIAYTLSVTDTKDATANLMSTIRFLDGVYYGTMKSKTDTAITSSAILELNKVLLSSPEYTFSVNAGKGDYIACAVPTAFASFGIYVGGLEGGFTKVKTFNFTNVYGFTESYDVYISTNDNLGATVVELH